MNDSIAVILGLATLVLFVVVYVWVSLALAAVFRKTGEAAWKAWVPVLNVAMILRIGGFSPWLFLLVLVPVFGQIAFPVILIIAIHRISTGFGYGGGMTVLGALLLAVWASILGFGQAQWQGAPVPAGRRSDDEPGPVRRGREFDGPYVPLVGGWTPSEDVSRDAFDFHPDALADGEEPRHPGALSEPVALPFAAPSGSLSDAVPAPVDWAPPPSAASAPATSVFDALDALRDSAPEERSPSGHGETPVADPVEERRAPAPHVPDAGRSADAGTASAVEQRDAVSDVDEPEHGDDASAAPWADVPRRAAAPSDPPAGAPIASVPLTRPAPPPEPVTPVPADAAGEGHEDFPEPSEAVSAVVGAPDAGAPRSARTSVSALYTQPEVPADAADDDIDAMDRTVVTRRRRIPWTLIPPGGAPVDLTSNVVILGRRPSADPSRPDAQLVSITDETRTVSKTHARLELRADTWYVTDLGSTNGVLFATLMGTEVEAPPGEEIEAGERFFLGDAEVRLARSEA